MKRWPVLMVACLALVLPACGDDDDSDGGSADTAQQPTETAEATDGGAQSPEISMKDTAFTPLELIVKKGTTVTWTNTESVGHDVQKTSGLGPKFSSGDKGGMKKGDTFKFTFKTLGLHDYVCAVHTDMTGRVVVE